LQYVLIRGQIGGLESFVLPYPTNAKKGVKRGGGGGGCFTAASSREEVFGLFKSVYVF
jgi:hypothetical protein